MVRTSLSVPRYALNRKMFRASLTAVCVMLTIALIVLNSQENSQAKVEIPINAKKTESGTFKNKLLWFKNRSMLTV